MSRPDEPERVMQHADRFKGGKALIVLGGPSGIGWKRLRNKINPDVIISCNGGVKVAGAEYWVLGENMVRKLHYALKGLPRYQHFVKIFEVENTAKYKMVNYQNWIPDRYGVSIGNYYHLDRPDVIKIRRIGFDEVWRPSLREYGPGLLLGGLFKRQKELGCRIAWRVGTVGIHCLHLAGILGCSEVHSIGFDLCFPDGRKAPHHWYDDPDYEVDSFRTDKVFTNQYGVDTQWDWIEGAQFIRDIQWLFERDQLDWHDHSKGLLQRMGIWCADEV